MGTSGFVTKKLVKMTCEHSAYERMDVFLSNYGHESSVSFLRMDVFSQNMGMRLEIFS